MQHLHSAILEPLPPVLIVPARKYNSFSPLFSRSPPLFPPVNSIYHSPGCQEKDIGTILDLTFSLPFMPTQQILLTLPPKYSSKFTFFPMPFRVSILAGFIHSFTYSFIKYFLNASSVPVEGDGENIKSRKLHWHNT